MNAIIAYVLFSVAFQSITSQEELESCGPNVKDKPEDFSPERLAALDEYHRYCQIVTSADQELVDKARSGEFKEDERLKNHFFCVAQQIGIQANSGDLQGAGFRKRVWDVVEDEDAVNEIALKCLIKKDTPQDSAFNTFRCVSKCTNYLGA